MEQDKVEKLTKLLDSGEDWTKLEAFPGIFIVKMPGKGRFPPSLSLEMNPVKSDGTPIKRKGLYITTEMQLNGFIEIFSNPELKEIFNTLQEVNQKSNPEPVQASKNKVIGKL